MPENNLGGLNNMDDLYGLYSVKDEIAKRFGPVFESINAETAARSFVLMMQKVDKAFRKEYSLYKLGTIDSITGVIIPETNPDRVLGVAYIEDINK